MPFPLLIRVPLAMGVVLLAACDAVGVHSAAGAVVTEATSTAGAQPRSVASRSDTRELRGCLHCAP